MKKVLVIGATGFIGSNLVKYLVNLDLEISILVRDRNNLDIFSQNLLDKLNIIEGDFLIPNSYLENLPYFDYIYQLAPGAISHGIRNEEDYSQEIIYASGKLFDFALNNNSKIIYASSIKVYGNCNDKILNENSIPNPTTIYGKTKLEIENLLSNFSKKGLDFVAFRNSNIYGPGQNPKYGAITTNFILNALNNKPLRIDGNPLYLINFIYIEDLLSAYIKAMDSNSNGIFNLCNEITISLEDYAKEIIKITNSKSIIDIRGERVDSLNLSNLDPSLLKKKLNWDIKFDIKEGLKRTIEYYKKMIFNINSNSKIVIFGGLGFIGENMLKYLDSQNFNNIILVERNFNINSSKYNLYLDFVKKYKIVNFNLEDDDFLILKDHLKEADLILNFTFPKDFNFILDKMILDFCKNHNNSCLNIFLGSRMQYDNSNLIYLEDTTLFSNHPYGDAKNELEKVYRDYSNNHNLPIIFTRNSNVLGLSRNFSNKITFEKTFFQNLLDKKKVYFDIPEETFKDFIYIDDFVKALFLLIQNPSSINETFNIGSGKKTYVSDFIKFINENYEDIEVSIEPKKNSDLESFCMDISKLKKFINWEPEFNISSSLNIIKDYFDKKE